MLLAGLRPPVLLTGLRPALLLSRLRAAALMLIGLRSAILLAGLGSTLLLIGDSRLHAAALTLPLLATVTAPIGLWTRGALGLVAHLGPSGAALVGTLCALQLLARRSALLALLRRRRCAALALLRRAVAALLLRRCALDTPVGAVIGGGRFTP